MNDRLSAENVSENSSVTDDTERSDSQNSVDKHVESTKMSVASNITRKIRTKLPNVAYYLKRLMRSRNGGKVLLEGEAIACSSEATEITESIINEQTVPEDGDSVERPESRAVQTGWHEPHTDPSNRSTRPDSEVPSTSTTNNRTSAYRPATTVVQTEPRQMISNSVNTTEAMTTNGIFVNVLNRESVVAGNILEFREALSSHLGWQTERLRDQESRTVPLVYIQSEDRQEVYPHSSVNGESGFSGSSTIGSEISSTSENDQPEVRNQRIGQDPNPQIFSGILNVDRVMRKPICRKDDEPTIY
ncbi:uncharacterized protein LOC143424852 [Xylocopa sonorina]|uniref:uncharacterized protein LOC143424852 n=1 Tax=Xylocopa sonorina TaxID=1818115 RepID=UPI00403B1783